MVLRPSNPRPLALVQECHKYPQLAEIAARVPPDAQLSKEQFQAHLQELDKSLRSLPATAQVRVPSIGGQTWPLCEARC